MPHLIVEEQRSIYSVDDQTPPPHNQVHFPYLYESSHGTWYMAHREGPHYAGMKRFGLTWNDEASQFLTDDRPQTVMSTDRGKTWRPWAGMPHRQRDLRLTITHLSDGSLLTYLSYFDETNSDVAQLCLLSSTDDGASWSRQNVPVSGLALADGRHGVLWGRILEIAPTHFLATYYGPTRAGSDDGSGRYFNGVIESRDQGRSWHHLAVIAGSETPGEEGPNEADMIHLGGQHLYAVFRTGDRDGSMMHAAFSQDLGKTWSTPKPFPGGEEGVSPQLIAVDDVLLIIFGRRVRGDRALVARISQDNARTWHAPFRIYEGTGKVYADVQRLPRNRVRVVYDASPVEHANGRVTNNIIRAVLRLE